MPELLLTALPGADAPGLPGGADYHPLDPAGADTVGSGPGPAFAICRRSIRKPT